MGQSNKLLNVRDIFFENPIKKFHIREISKLLGIPKTTVNYHVDNLLKENLIVKIKQKPFPSYRADETGGVYKFYKRQEFLRKILETGLVDYLYKELNPRCIILFGSFAKAEYDEGSDIDIFVQAKEIKISLEKFEKKLRHPINLYFKEDINSLSKELFNNIMNGIKLNGYIKIK